MIVVAQIFMEATSVKKKKKQPELTRNFTNEINIPSDRYHGTYVFVYFYWNNPTLLIELVSCLKEKMNWNSLHNELLKFFISACVNFTGK